MMFCEVAVFHCFCVLCSHFLSFAIRQFMHEATEFFLNENLPRFICGEDLLNPVDPKLGY